MHLLFINRFFYPDQSATARILTDLATALVAQGFRVTVLTGRVGYLDVEQVLPPRDTYKGVIVQRIWSSGFGRHSAVGRLADYLSFYLSAAWVAICSKGVDCLIVLSDPPMLSVLAVLLGRLKGWKTLCWLQDVFPEIAVEAGLLKDGRVTRVLRQVARWSLRGCHRVIAVGRCMERYLLRVGTPQDRIVVIPNWADGDCLTPVAPHDNWFRKEHELDGRLVVMYSGNLGVVHETDALLEVVRRLQVMPEVCVLFVGEGQGKDRLEEWARREAMQHVRFLSYQAQESLRYSLSAGDIHLVTLRPEMEGLSIPSKVYGILAVGRPVVFIGPEGSEVAALVREAGCGEVFSPAEHEKAAVALLTLAQDAERQERLGMAGRRYFEAVLDKTLAIQRFRAVFVSMGSK